MVANVEASVEMRVESDAPPRPAEDCRLRVRMLGSLELRRDGTILPLPASRKVKALLAYLALAPRGSPGASSASFSGTSRTILAASCAGA